jgi:AcrR family transcriptional regulator
MRRSDLRLHPEPEAPPTALLEAAFRVFAERGYRATRLEEVAEAVGVTKGAIYYYFSSKEDLLRRAVQSRHRAIFTEIREAVATERAPASVKVRLALRKVWRHWLDPEWGHALRLMLGEVSMELPALFRHWAEVGPIEGWTLVESLIEEGKRTGEFRPDADAAVAARLLLSGLMLQATLHVHMGLADLSPCDPDRIFDSSVEVVLHGLAAPQALPPTGVQPTP